MEKILEKNLVVNEVYADDIGDPIFLKYMGIDNNNDPYFEYVSGSNYYLFSENGYIEFISRPNRKWYKKDKFMILTGKTKEDFLNYYGTGENYFTKTLTDVEKYANIIDWFDSVGIYINTVYYPESLYFKCFVDNGDTCHFINSEKTRQEAIKQAILKANEIYNEEHS